MSSIFTRINLWFAKKRFGQADSLSDFYDELLETIQMNIGINQFLESRRQTARRRKSNDVAVYSTLLRRMESGDALSEAGRGYLPDSNRIMIEAGEHVNQIGEGVKTALFANESSAKMRSIITKYMVKPCGLAFADIGLLMLFGVQVVPPFLTVIPVEKLPAALRFSFNFASFVVNYSLLVVPLLIAAILWIVWSLRNYGGTARRYLDLIPPYSIYRHIVSSEVMITFSGLLRNNVTMQDAIGLMLQNSSPYERSHLLVIRKRMNKGEPITVALDTGLVPRRIIDRLRSFESAGSSHLEEAMRKMGFENVDRSLKIVEVGVKFSSDIIFLMAGSVLGWLFFDVFMLAPQLMASVQATPGSF